MPLLIFLFVLIFIYFILYCWCYVAEKPKNCAHWTIRWNKSNWCFYTAKYANLVPFSRHGPHDYNDRCKLPAWTSTPIYPPRPYTDWWFSFDVIAIRRLCGSRGGTWVEVLLRCLYNRNDTISTWVVLMVCSWILGRQRSELHHLRFRSIYSVPVRLSDCVMKLASR